MFDADKGWIAFWGEKLELPENLSGELMRFDNGITILDNCLHKFPQDEILAEHNKKIYWMDGFILNKNELMADKGMSNWRKVFIEETEKEDFPNRLRGGFSGFISEEDSILLYNDHVGNHAVYYYHQNGMMICSTRVYYILELLKYNRLEPHFNVRAAQYMLEQGYMIDESTFICEIKRVLPGQKIKVFRNGREELVQYYRLDNRHVKHDMTEEEAVELIDKYFRQAVKREFDKDKEYGYEYLVDLSGGLDSRMVCWVAHDMGYTEQLNVTHCKNGYLDFQIAQKIAIALKHSFSYMPLDDFQWFCEIDEMSRKNNGASLYMGITGGNRHFKILDKERFAINHTGMVGDAIVGSFFHNPTEGYDRPDGTGQNYSDKVHYDIEEKILDKYANQELYLLYVRGLLCAQTSYFTIQTYYETSSPFLDIDFLEAVLSVPPGLRCRHHIYLKWLEWKYPEAAEFGWEKWKGLKPKSQNVKRVKYWKWYCRKVNQMKMRITKCEPEHIHPTDYWYENNAAIQERVEKYFYDRITLLEKYPDLSQDAQMIFSKGKTNEKAQAITVLSWAAFVLG